MHINDQLAKLIEENKNIMSAISEYGVKAKSYFDRLNASIDGIVGDIKGLNDLIKKLQDSSGQSAPEDKKILDDLQNMGEAVAVKAEALDAMTPPVVPAA